MKDCKAIQDFLIKLSIWHLQKIRTQTFLDFLRCPRGILISTDVAARGLDFPKVTCIVQYDPPGETTECATPAHHQLLLLESVGIDSCSLSLTNVVGESMRVLCFYRPKDLAFGIILLRASCVQHNMD